MIISAIAAVSRNGVIGKKNRLPWHLPADMRFFKQTTLGHPVIMGRKTYVSFGKALPGRTNIVITRQLDYALPDGLVTHSLEEAIHAASQSNPSEIFILGGAQIYRESLPWLDRVYKTLIEGEFEGDAFFPELDPDRWTLTTADFHEADEKNKYAYTFQTWERTN
jgi:dihydrofolate reductase